MIRFGLIGSPITHSLSPTIYRYLANYFDLNIQYDLFPVNHGRFADFLKTASTLGLKGFNVTAPLKKEVFNTISNHTSRARAANAVNTVLLGENSEALGENTDGVGCLRDLQKKFGSLNGKNIAIYGAGGAAYGLVSALLTTQCTQISIYNRSIENSLHLQAHFNDNRIQLGSKNREGFDLIINTLSSLHFSVELFNAKLNEGGFAYDLTYHRKSTPFLSWASANKAYQVSGGLGMLIQQAFESFNFFFKIKPYAFMANHLENLLLRTIKCD